MPGKGAFPRVFGWFTRSWPASPARLLGVVALPRVSSCPSCKDLHGAIFPLVLTAGVVWSMSAAAMPVRKPASYRPGLALGVAYTRLGRIRKASAVYDDKKAQYRDDAGMLLAVAYHDQGSYRGLRKPNPRDAAGRERHRQPSTRALIHSAYQLMRQKDYAAVIALLKPHFHPSSPSYGIGMVLARAYTASRNPDRAAAVYKRLEHAFPADKELRELRVRALLAARRYPEASRLYQLLAPPRRKVLADSLGYQARHLYLYSASLGGQYVKDSNGFPNERFYELRLKAVTRAGTFVGHYRNENRFNMTADNYRIDYYYDLNHGWYGYLSYAHSPQHSFLADNDFTLAVNKTLGPVTLRTSVRHLAFSQSSADVYFAGAGFYPWRQVYMVTGAFYVPQTGGYSVMVEPIWFVGNGEVYAFFTAGQIGEQLNVSGAVRKTASYSVRVGRRLDFTPRLGLSVEGFYEHRTGLYNRAGVGLYLTWRW